MDEQLAALESILDLTDHEDWPYLHDTVSNMVKSGELSKVQERHYAKMVDGKLVEMGILEESDLD